MFFTIEFRALATIEIQEAYDYYNLMREGLGEEFLNELQSFLNIIEINPFTFSYVQEPVRQGKLNKFPYVVVYETFDIKIIIYSVFMAKQNPSKKRFF